MENRSPVEIIKKAACLAIPLALAACGAGGGGAPLAGGGPSFTCTGASEFDFEAVFSDSNTYCTYGPGMIGADSAYAKGATGAGALVAVIDTGVDPTHTELDAKISPDSIDIVRGDPMADEDGHGTLIAGIIAAEKNGVANHGVAYDSTILAIRSDTRVSDPVTCGGPDPCSVFFDADIAAALNYAAAKSADVINMSLGGPVPLSPTTEQALIDAMAAGAIVVAAVGNEGAAPPAYPAAYAGDATVNASGQMIAVGAVDESGTIAPFSSWCGAALDSCLVAPGVDIISPYPGNNLVVGSGTSQAAAFVSGAAALLAGTWPTLMPDEVVTILLTTATDLGTAGVDPVYGHGLVNLDAAVAPLGSLTIPLSDSPTGQTATLAGTVLSLGPAFGDALNGSPLLGEAFALDDFDRNFVAGLDSHVFRAKRGFGLQALMASGGIEAIETELANGANLSMGVVENTRAESATYWAGMAADAVPERRVHGLSLAMTGGDGTSWRFGYDLAPGQLISDAAATSATLFWMAGDLMNPHHALVGAGTAIVASRSLGARNTISLDMVDEADSDDAIAGDARMGEIVLARTIGDGAVVTARISNLDEQEGFLGAGAAGGFAVEGANSWFYQLGGRLPLGAGVELLGSYTLARTDMAGSGASVLSDWSGAQADAFGFGIVKSNVLGAGGRIGFLAGQPLRVSSASASLTVPVGYELDKTVVQESERVSLVPSGREIDVQLAYDAPVGAQGSFAGWLMMQLEPGHDADAATAYAVGLRFGMSF